MEKGGLSQALRARRVTQADGIGWSDEFRIGLFGQVRRVLAPRGIKVRQRVQLAHTARYLAVVVDPREGRLRWQWVPSTTGAALAEAVTTWRTTAGITTLVWDRMAAHDTEAIHATGVVSVRQPPAAPELNPAERVGELLRDALEGQVYATLDDKVDAADRVLTALADDPERVKRLTGYPWILQRLKTLRKGT